MQNKTIEALKTVAWGALVVTVGSVISRLLNYLYKLLVARLGPESFGALSLCLTLLGVISTLAFLGIPEGVKRFISFYRGKNDNERLRSTIQSSLFISLVASAIFAGLTFLNAERIARLFFHEESSAAYVYFVAAILPFYVVYWICVKCFAGFKNMKFRVYVYDIAENTLKIVFTVVLLAIGLRFWSALLGWGLAIAFCALFALYLLEFKVVSVLRTPYQGASMHRELLGFSIPLLFSGLLVFVLSWTDTLMLGYLSTLGNVGIYGAALLVSSLVFIGTDILTPIYLPVVTEFYAQKQKQVIKSIFESVNKWVFAMCVPLAFLIFIFPREILGILFPEEYAPACQALLVLTAGRLIYAFSFTSVHMLNMMGKTRAILVTSVLATLLNVILNYIFIPRFGIVGAAVATSISLFVQSLLLIAWTFRYLQMHIFTLDSAKVTLSALAPALVVLVMQWRLERSLAVFIGLSGVYAIAYAVCLYVFKAYDDKDVAVFKLLTKKKGREA